MKTGEHTMVAPRLKHKATQQILAIVIAALTAGGTGLAYAAPAPAGQTTTGSLSISGTVQETAACDIVSPPVFDASYALPGDSTGIPGYYKSSSMVVNCTAGTNFTLSVPQRLNPISAGSGTMDVFLEVSQGYSYELNETPLAFTGTGGAQSIVMYANFRGPNGTNIISSIHGGTVSGSIVMTMAY